jgi:3-methyladenine DNA glycosylase/8-oxoguanine DNA glycosylase
MGSLEVEVRPTSPYRLPRGSSDRTLRVDGGVARRLLHVEGSPVLVRAWQPARDRVVFRAEAVDPGRLLWPRDAARIRRAARPQAADEPAPACRDKLGTAIERMRFALGVDYDLAPFHARFRRDPLLAPLIHRAPHHRPRRVPWPWEALATAVVGQLIEASRAAVIERRIVGRWGARLGDGPRALRDVPAAATIAGRAPAELQAMDLSGPRAVALCKLARLATSGRCDVGDPATDPRLLAVPEIGPWTIQCLTLFGRGDMDSLPAGDLGYIKLVGVLANLGRRATIPEVEEFYAPYAPYRGLVGSLTLSGHYRAVQAAGPMRLSPEARAEAA